ncbi:MAG: helix-turn-helix domain-containing protein [Clostridia bacterium]|nr:helix-turn-helix domain-containing protein [Clostridia bacterium]
MTETANVQFNNFIPLPFAQPYIKIPSGLKGLTVGARLVGGLIYSFSGVLDKDGVYSTMSRPRKSMKESLFLSLSTLSRSIASLTAKGYVSKLSRDEYIFNRDMLKSPDEFTRIEFNEIKEIMDGCTRSQGVRELVFAWFNTHCNNDKKSSDKETEALRKDHKVAASYSDIAEAVGCSDRQAIRAVRWLLKHDYIHRPEEDKGTSKYNKSVYSLDKAYWRRKKRKDIAPTTAPEPEETPEQQATAARQAWLNQIKTKAEIEAEHNTQRAQRNKRYMEAHKRVVGLEVEIAFAELGEPEKAAQLEIEHTRWVLEETAALKALGLTKELLDEDYLFKLYSAGGAPPNGNNNVGVGELNK